MKAAIYARVSTRDRQGPKTQASRRVPGDCFKYVVRQTGYVILLADDSAPVAAPRFPHR
jgi:hypothetical protein